MLFNLTSLSSEPVYRQISRQLLERILSGAFYDGSELPSPRLLAREQHVNVNTVKRAYQELERKGFIIRNSEKRFWVPVFTEEEKRALRMKILNGRSNEDSAEFLNRQLIAALGTLNLSDILQELDTAHRIQADLMPSKLPANERIRMAAYSQPSHTLGGDFYDCIPLEKNRFGMVIGDACGKGLPAAIVISQIQGMMRSEVNNGNSIEKILSNINQQLVQFTPRNSFATLFYGVFDQQDSNFCYATAGHNYPIRIRCNGGSDFLQQGGPALGLLASARFKSATVNLAPGDMLFLYTDGVTETMNPSREEYGEERLQDLLLRSRHLNPQEIIQAVLDDSENYADDNFTRDDRTMLVLKIKEK
jgi:sigma-B regulation protein RsbU (phosphoserine phosphatase)